MEGVVKALEATVSPDGSVRKQAEEALKSFEAKPGFVSVLLSVVEQGQSPHVKQIAAITFKNLVVREWDEEDRVVPSKLGAEDRAAVKQRLLDIMCRVDEKARTQLSVALAQISNCEYPHKWPELLTELMKRLQTSDFGVIVAILFTINACFKRFRNVRDSDAERLVLRAALDTFGVPMLEFFRKLDQYADQQAGNKAALEALFEAMRLLFRVLYSFSQFDLPDVVEDHLEEWMRLHLKYLTVRADVVVDTTEDDVAGPLERLKAAAMENVALFSDQFDEDFEPYFQGFADAVWKELTTASAQPKNDRVVIGAMHFLARAMTRTMHSQQFSKPETLRGIVDQIVVPNMQLREDDEERFEDDPVDFIRRHYEGSDTGTRHRAACDVLREAAKTYHPSVTQICNERIAALMTQHARDPASGWKAKDVAITMFMAVAAKAETRGRGVMETNSHCDVGAFLSQHVLPELTKDPNADGLTKSACLRCVIKFRNQLPKEALLKVLELMMAMLRSTHTVVRTLAAITLERILVVKDAPPQGAAGARPQPRIGREDLRRCLGTVLPLLFQMVSGADAENEHVMRAIMRVVCNGQEDVAPFIGDVLSHLTVVLERVCGQPSNPQFTHFLFETLAVLIRNACSASSGNVASFERTLFPPFQAVLQRQVSEVTPYVFQILAQLLELSPAGVSEPYKALFPPLLHPAQWENRGNIPALVRLLNAYTRVGGTSVLHDEALQGVLGVYQKLISSRAMQQHGFSLVTAIVVHLPLAAFQKYLGTILQLMLSLLHRGLQGKVVRPFLGFVGRLIGKHGPGPFLEALVGIQSTLPNMVIAQIVVPKMPLVLNPLERKCLAVGVSRLLAESPVMAQSPLDQSLPGLLAGLASITHGDIGSAVAVSSSLVDDDADAVEVAAETASYSAGFAQLGFAREQRVDPFKEVADVGDVMAKALGAFSSKNPGKLPDALKSLESAKQQPLVDLMNRRGVQIA